MFRRFWLMVTVVVVALAMMIQPALAVIRSNTIDPNATVSADGSHVVVGGPIACDKGERLWIWIVVAQASSHAWGTGHTQLMCTGDVQRWSVNVQARGATSFESGHAEACALGITRHQGTTTDIRQWCADTGIALE